MASWFNIMAVERDDLIVKIHIKNYFICRLSMNVLPDNEKSV